LYLLEGRLGHLKTSVIAEKCRHTLDPSGVKIKIYSFSWKNARFMFNSYWN